MEETMNYCDRGDWRGETGDMCTYKEKLEILDAFQKDCTKKVFQDDYAVNLRMTDLRMHLNDQARKLSFTGDPVYRSVDRSLNRFCCTLGGMKNGAKGEWITYKALRHLPEPNVVLKNVCLEYGDELEEFDSIVLNEKGISFQETKYSTTDVVVDEHGMLGGKNVQWREPYNVCERMRTKKFVLSHVLEPVFGDTASMKNIRDILVFANDSCSFEDRSGFLTVCRPGDLPYILESGTCNDALIDSEQIRQIAEMISENSKEAKYPLGFDLDELWQQIDYVMELVAQRSDEERNAPREEHAHESYDPENIEEEYETPGQERPDVCDHRWLVYATPVVGILVIGAIVRPDLYRKVLRLIGI
jgi:hypothetical protein